MRILITGITGFVGGHLVERLLDSGHELHGLSRRAAWSPEWSHLDGLVHLHAVDLTDPVQADSAIRAIRPERIFHLAGYANPGLSFREPDKTWATNLQATFHLYESVSRSGLRPRILFASTGLAYGVPEGDHPCSESDPLCPASPYAASKAAAEMLSYQVTRSPGLDVFRVRCFNQIGPRQCAQYATANFARQIAAIEVGRQAPIVETGDLSGSRDLTDVRDIVRALVMLMEQGRDGEAYNAGSGRTLPMQMVLERMRALARVPIDVRQVIDPARRAETGVLRADIGKLHAATGWRPEYTLDRTLADILDYWRELGDQRQAA